MVGDLLSVTVTEDDGVFVVVPGREDIVVRHFGGYLIGVIPCLCITPSNSVFHVVPLELLEFLIHIFLEMFFTTYDNEFHHSYVVG